MTATSRLSDSADISALIDSIQASTLASLPRARLVHRLSVVASASGALMVLIGIVTAAGWFTGDLVLARVTGLASMKLSTAACVAVSGVAILSKGATRPAVRRSAVGLAVVVGAFALVTLAEYALDLTSDLDNWFGLDPGRLGGDPPGRMSVATACALVLLSMGLVLGYLRRYWPSQLAATLCGTIAAVTLVGYAYGADSLYEIGPFRSISLTTAVALLLGGIGVTLRHADEGYVALLSGNTAGGIIVRRFLPVAVVVPILAAGLVVQLQTDEVARQISGPIAVAASLVGVIGGALVWVQASRLRSIDLRRAGAEDAFAIAREALRAQELAERRTRAIITASAAGYLAFDLAGRVTDVNAAASALFDLTREQMVGVRVDGLVSRSAAATDEQDSRSDLRRFLDGQGPRPPDQRYAATAVTHDGRFLHLDCILWSVEDEDAGLDFHMFLTDVTERTQVEIELRRAHDDLADFSAAMAHDLRTPLTVVKGFSSMLRKRLDGEAEAEWVARIEGAADRGARLIDDILLFAQVGRGALDRLPVDLEALARQVADDQLEASDRGGTVEVARLPRSVRGDRALLTTLVSNLVGNALKHVPADRSPAVVVDSAVDPATGWPVVRVSDNGDPIAAPDRLFEMFHRGAADDRTVGSGVGLAVCRRIAELHGGRIWLETSEAGGPRFCVLLSGASGRSGG